MRISPIMVTNVAMSQRTVQKVHSPVETRSNINFEGGAPLKFGDYLAGAICGTAMAAVGFAIAGPLGAIAMGAIGAKTTAEANSESRND